MQIIILRKTGPFNFSEIFMPNNVPAITQGKFIRVKRSAGAVTEEAKIKEARVIMLLKKLYKTMVDKKASLPMFWLERRMATGGPLSPAAAFKKPLKNPATPPAVFWLFSLTV